MLQATTYFLGLLLAVYVGVNVFAYANQRGMMYMPSTQRVSPEEVGLHEVEEVTLITASNVELISWYARPKDGRPTVLFCHGNAGAIAHRAFRFHELMANGYGVFVLGYPGYGGNGGKPSEASFHEASQLAYDHLRAAGIDAGDIVIHGTSIGSGIAVQLAARVPAKALILEAPMSSAVDVARAHYPYLLAGRFMRDRYQSVDHIGSIDMPLLVIHGEKDTIIPLRLGQKLVEHALEPKTLVVIEGAGHNNLNNYSTNSIAREFIESL